eukprot:750502-Amphidinium_carterae.1
MPLKASTSSYPCQFARLTIPIPSLDKLTNPAFHQVRRQSPNDHPTCLDSFSDCLGRILKYWTTGI